MLLDFSSIKEEFESYEEVFADLADYILDYLKIKADVILSVSLIDNKLIKEINSQYRNIDRETDVISFAFIDSLENGKELLNKEGILNLGEIYISLEKAKQQAEEYQHSFNREMCFLFVHGLLHLLGYDHMNEDDEKIMFKLQDEILVSKGILK